MHHKYLKSVKLRGKSPEAKTYLKTKHKPHVDQVAVSASQFPVAVLIWAPLDAGDREAVSAQYTQLKKQVAKIRSGLAENNITFRKLFPRKKPAGPDAMIIDLRKHAAKADLVFALVSDDRPLLNHLIGFRAEVPEKLVLFIDTKTKTEFVEFMKKRPEFRDRTDFEASFRKINAFGFFHGLDAKVLNAVGCVQLLKYLREKEDEDGAGLKETYTKYEHEIDVFMNKGYAAFLSLLRHLGSTAMADLRRHTFLAENDIGDVFEYFVKIGYLIQTEETRELTESAELFFDMFDFNTLQTLEQEKKEKEEEEERQRRADEEDRARRENEAKAELENRIALFKERWMFHISGTYNSTHKLWMDQAELKKLFENLYLPIAQKDKLTLWFTKKWKGFFGVKKDPKKKTIWDNPLVKRLYDIWRLDISGPVRGPWAERRERARFMGYVMSKVRVAYDPAMQDKYINYKNLIFGLKILRQNPYAHVYINNSFLIRPLKNCIRQYFDMALMTGEYEVLLKRYPPYWNLLNLYVAPGDRTFIDLRGGLDIFPFTYRLDFNFTVSPDLRDIQSRRKDCLVTCPFIVDQEAQAIKESEVAGLEKTQKGIFDFPSYLGDIDFDDNGNVIFLGGKEKSDKPLGAYGPRRGNYINTRDLLALTRANPRPSLKSGLIIRFNLADPIKVLLNGINGKRPVSLDEIIKLWKCLEIVMKPKGIDNLNDAIPAVFKQQRPKGVKQETAGFLADIEYTAISEGEEAAWGKIMPFMVEGRNKFLNQVICRMLTTDGFEFVFSLWPLITGQTVKYDMKTMEITEEEKVVSKKADKMPLVDNLKHEIEILLKNVLARSLDISGATAFWRSEPILAGMIVELCLCTKEYIYPKLERDIRDHLLWHYKTHFSFLSRYVGAPDKKDDELQRFAEKDFRNIIAQINETRNRLLSRTENNRLLRYLDPDSINVQVGEFEYSAKIAAEIDFIKKDIGLKKELSQLRIDKDIEIQKTDIEKEKEFELHDIEIQKLKHKAKWDRTFFEADAERAVWDAGVLKVKDLDLQEIEMDKMRTMKMRERDRDMAVLKGMAKRAIEEAEIEKSKDLDLQELEMDKTRTMKMRERDRDMAVLKGMAKRAVEEAEIDKNKEFELHEIEMAKKRHMREWEHKIFEALAKHEIMEAEVLKDKALDLQQIEMDQTKEIKMRERNRDMAVLKAMATRAFEEAEIDKDKAVKLQEIEMDKNRTLKMKERERDMAVLRAMAARAFEEAEIDKDKAVKLQEIEMDKNKTLKMKERERDMAVLKAMAVRAIEEAKIKKDKHLELHHIELEEHEKKVEGDLKMLEHIEDEKKILQEQIKKSLKEFELDAIGNLRLGQLRELAYFALLRTYQDKGSVELERILAESPYLLTAMDPELRSELELGEFKENIMKIIEQTNKGIEPISISMLLEQDPSKIAAAEIYEKINAHLVNALEFARLAPQLKFPLPEKKLTGSEDNPAAESAGERGERMGDADVIEATVYDEQKGKGKQTGHDAESTSEAEIESVESEEEGAKVEPSEDKTDTDEIEATIDDGQEGEEKKIESQDAESEPEAEIESSETEEEKPKDSESKKEGAEDEQPKDKTDTDPES